MTLEEAIKHCEEQAFRLTEGIMSALNEQEAEDCRECAKEHEQLASWLKELKDYREGLRTCENCKHELKPENEYPCSICKCNHPNKFEWKGGAE